MRAVGLWTGRRRHGPALLLGFASLALATSSGCAAVGESPAMVEPTSPVRPYAPRPITAPMGDPPSGGAALVGFSMRPGRALLPPGEAIELVVALDVASRAAVVDRPPLDVSLVFDNSGSMGERGKLAFTLQAARLLVANLSPRDTLSIIAFDAEAVVLDRQQAVTRKLYLSHWFDELEPGGQTNISGGLLAGLAELRRARRPGTLARVLLLTDGHANRGVTARDDLVAIAARAHADGIDVSAIGVGADFDERLLVALARQGGGRYTHVADPEMIPAAVAHEVEGLLPVVAQNVEVTVETFAGVEVLEPLGDAEPRRALLGRTEAGAANPPDAVVVGDLLPEERRTVLARLRVSASAGGELRQILRARLTYQDPRGAGIPVVDELTLVLPLAETESASADTVDAAVVGAARLAEVLELAYRALLSRDRDLTASALREIAAARDDLEALRRHGEDETVREHAALLAHLGEELEELKAGGAVHGHEEEETGPEPELPPRFLLLHHWRQATGADDR